MHNKVRLFECVAKHCYFL